MRATCADHTRRADEPLAGSAPTALGWFCVEQSGAWGRDAVRESGLPEHVGAALQTTVTDLDVRLQVIRRPSHREGRSRHGAPRTVLLAHTGDEPWLEVVEVADVEEVADLDPAVCLSPTPPGLGRRVTEPRYLVCTHGKRDRCCATYGRPIADTLAALHPSQTWEVSHVGGHRYAGNLVVLPHGNVHGGLDVAGAVRVVDLLAADRLDVPSARGRSGLSRAAQAADVLGRTKLDVDALGGVVAGDVQPLAGGHHRVHLDVQGRAYEAEVVEEPTGRPRLVSCDAAEPEDPGVWRLVSLTAV
ncbi:sucrase ferredoxin [Egicoccus sp. AB-alg2]|uniref:sucrase ferredoxin n=1 Tax=Egicoccus sp. AB-alg2 TaxID=3242693 RepID=UPI00359D70D4